jgi:meso-butanediol dehydrogenase/(S,S)-butanediol dehydrogenase/diacetyl reductase
MRFRGLSVGVTGGGSGIGRAIALRVATEGGRVMIGDINESSAHGVAREIAEAGGVADARHLDVTSRASISAFVEAIIDQWGSIDILFNNAGVNRPQPFLEVTEEVWRAVLDVNALGVLLGTQEAAKRMIRQGRGGVIINTASIASRQGYASFVAYCAAKFAVVAITQAAARALAKHGIRVNGFAPGVVDTPLWTRLDHDLMEIGDSRAPGEAMRNFVSTSLIGRPATPADIAGTAVFLASSDAGYITGQIVMVDGGMVLV